MTRSIVCLNQSVSVPPDYADAPIRRRAIAMKQAIRTETAAWAVAVQRFKIGIRATTPVADNRVRGTDRRHACAVGKDDGATLWCRNAPAV